ncbi:MAG: type II toxin-antitoxin system VapC family toxin [Eubacterium sp.]|nr:type II toxin-antitoxin system VapC family toxin [Eubacterium sp.]MCM1213790.1 type II toxin-antitoxin system VapC family toxin [Lachnospiraceae bacterium]MCM1237909.1 type II toxin-antitoxin system VapC family toxin [Lachnospiraceae bacterium]
MDILLDTHLLLWVLIDDPRLPVQAKNIILNEENTIFYSIASVWEVAIKHIKKPDQMLLNDDEFIKGCKMAGFRAVPIKEQHIALLKTLKRRQGKDVPEHHDPFDRLLICQSKAESMKFLTHDLLIPYYEEPFIISV